MILGLGNTFEIASPLFLNKLLHKKLQVHRILYLSVSLIMIGEICDVVSASFVKSKTKLYHNSKNIRIFFLKMMIFIASLYFRYLSGSKVRKFINP